MAFPLRDESTRRQVPWTVLTLIAVNVAIFLFLQPASLQRGESETGSLSRDEQLEVTTHFAEWGSIPCEVRSLESRADGAGGRCTRDTDDRPLVDGKPVLASLLTALFLHGSIIHLAANMLFLWVFGAAVEDRFGPGPFLGLYLVGGVAGTLAYVAVNSGSAEPVVGASGAISAVMGAFLLIGGRRRILSFVAPLPLVVVTLPAWALLGPYLVSQLVTPDDTAVAVQAHAGGMVAGFVIALVLRFFIPTAGQVRRRRRDRTDAPPPVDPATWTIPDRPPVTAEG